MKISVLQEDIDKGDKHSYKTCPLALAISRKVPQYDVLVALMYVTLGKNKKDALIFKLSRPARKFIDDFDRGLSVSPQSFILKPFIVGPDLNYPLPLASKIKKEGDAK